MAKEQGTQSTDQRLFTSDKLYMENTLLRVAGALFCHDAKRAPTRTHEIELNRGVKEKTIVVRPDPRLGQPGPLAHKIFVAILKKHSNYGRPIRNEVSFTKRELMRLVGRSDWGGRDSEQLTRALNEIHYTFIRTNFKGREGGFIEHSFNVFPEVYLERAEYATDPVETCVVTLARPIIASLEDEHFTCLNHALMQQLGTIGQALYMRLFFHFANLYDGHHPNRLSFPKRYDDICSEWLGGLTVLKFRSKIEQEQLGPHLRRLVELAVLASYHIHKAANGSGLVITFRPGAAFFLDYVRFYRHRNQADLQFDFHDDQHSISEPLKVAYLFIQRRTGHIPAGVSSKDKDTARQFLQHIPFEEMEKFLDYSLAEAKKTNYEPQTLGGIRQYVPGYLQSRNHQAAAKAAEATRLANERQDATRLAYDRFRRIRADQLFETLPKAEQGIIEGLARASNSSGFAATNGSFAKTMFDLARARITAERHPDKIQSLEQWTDIRRAA
jgi:hypothetical protein